MTDQSAYFNVKYVSDIDLFFQLVITAKLHNDYNELNDLQRDLTQRHAG